MHTFKFLRGLTRQSNTHSTMICQTGDCVMHALHACTYSKTRNPCYTGCSTVRMGTTPWNMWRILWDMWMSNDLHAQWTQTVICFRSTWISGQTQQQKRYSQKPLMLYVALNTTIYLFTNFALRVIQTITHAWKDGRIWRLTWWRKCGPSLTRQASSWLYVTTVSCFLLQIWWRVMSCKWLSLLQPIGHIKLMQMPFAAQYSLAVVAKMMDVFGDNLASAYDIGCQFKTTVRYSTLGQWAKDMHHTFLVDEFHRFVHNCLCQVDNLTTYCKGLRIEDFSSCEWAFSKSNSLAACTRHMSIFWQRQAIGAYFAHQDTHEVWQNLSTYITNSKKISADALVF